MWDIAIQGYSVQEEPVVGSSSPLSGLVNSLIVYEVRMPTLLMGGRYESSGGSKYILRGFLKVESSKVGASSGELDSWGRRVSVGGITDGYYYRGYVLEYCEMPSGFELGVSSVDNLDFVSVLDSSFDNNVIDFSNGSRIRLQHGTVSVIDAEVTRWGGRYNSVGIDEIVYNELGGMPILLKGSQTM